MRVRTLSDLDLRCSRATFDDSQKKKDIFRSIGQANVLAPVKQWGRPPASESSRPKSAQRLHEAREKDSKFNQSVGRPGETS